MDFLAEEEGIEPDLIDFLETPYLSHLRHKARKFNTFTSYYNNINRVLKR